VVELITVVGFTEHIYKRALSAVEGITEEELLWRPVHEMNTAGKILRHMARISLVLLPQVVEGTTTGSWDDDYEQSEHSLPEMLSDLEAGRVKVLKGLQGLEDRSLEVEIPLWGGTHRRVEGINMLVSELVYHAGQIALLRGAYSRMKKN
jgi:DinB superfamily